MTYRFDSCIHLLTCKEERVGVSTDDDVDSADLLGDVLIDGEAGVTQSDDLIHAQRLQFVDLQLQRGHLVLKLQVCSCTVTVKQMHMFHCTNINI